MTVGENIKQLRISRKWSQQNLADVVGLSRNYISELENNKRNISIATLNNLTDKLGVPIGSLMNSNTSKDNLERILDVLYEFDYNGLSTDDLKTLRDTFYNEFQTVEKHIRYSNELEEHK